MLGRSDAAFLRCLDSVIEWKEEMPKSSVPKDHNIMSSQREEKEAKN